MESVVAVFLSGVGARIYILIMTNRVYAGNE